MAEFPTINIELYALTDVGMVRSGNEDNFLILDLSTGRSWTANEEEPNDLLTYEQGYYGTLLAVSDGMGGALAGEVASRMAVDTVRHRMLYLQAQDHYKDMPFQERLRLAIEEANILINGESQTNPAHKGLGATFTSAAVFGTDLYFAQVGDSRALIVRKGKIHRVTKDQSLVQQLIDAGQISEEEAETHHYRNVILQALGAHSNVNVEINRVPLYRDDVLIICSDGLTGKLNQNGIAEIISESDDFKNACQHLIDNANDLGGEDNITVVLAKFTGEGLPLPPDDNADEVGSVPLQRSPDTPTEINWYPDGGTNPLELPEDVSSVFIDQDDLTSVLQPSFAVTAELPRLPLLSSEYSQPIITASIENLSQDSSADEIQAVGSNPDGSGSAARRGPITIVLPRSSDDADDSTQEVIIAAEQANSDTQHQSIGDFFVEESTVEKSSLSPFIENIAAAVIDTEAPTGELSLPTQLIEEKPVPPPIAPPTQYAPIVIPRGATSELKKSRSTFYIVVGLVTIGITGLILGAFSYYIRQNREQSAVRTADDKARVEYETQKDSQISNIREKITELNSKIQTIVQPEFQDRRNVLNTELNKLNQRLDYIRIIPANDFQKINQNCDELKRDLLKLESDIGF